MPQPKIRTEEEIRLKLVNKIITNFSNPDKKGGVNIVCEMITHGKVKKYVGYMKEVKCIS